MESALSAHGVHMDYRDRRSGASLIAIESMDLDVGEGQFVSLLGPSGCGKSTFLKIVNGLLLCTSGQIKVRSLGKAREDAMVFQDAALFPWYSILDNVAYGLVCAGVRRAEARKRAMPFIELVGLSGFEGKYPYQLSGGMQQRANLARALTVDSALLLILADVHIELPRPRSLDIKRSTRFTAYEEQISTLIGSHQPAAAASRADGV